MTMWKEFALIAILAATAVNQGCHAGGVLGKKKSISGGAVAIPAGAVQFFQGGKEPSGLTGDAVIEQMFAGKGPFFTTMYNKTKRSPVYSAYRVLPADALNLGANKRPQGVAWTEYAGDTGHDPVYRANTPAGYTRGHLNPSQLNSFNPDAMKATFTYSNAVPQWAKSNGVTWSAFETKLAAYAKTTCGAHGGTLFLLTGPADFGYDGAAKVAAVPGKIESADKTQSLPVPPSLWTAGCCWNKNSGAESIGVIGLNKQTQAEAKTFNIGLNQLQSLLGATLFPGDVNNDCGKKTAAL